MKLIDERNIRTKMRKIAKKKFDKLVDLAVSDNYSEPIRARLLDEGAVTYANGEVDFYIAKGALEKYYNSLDDDYVGTINLGHMDFATFPILLGEWRKSDLHLVDVEDGRKALDVDVRLDSSLSIVQDLWKQPFAVGLSAEFTVHENLAMTDELSAKVGRYIPVFDELFIGNFAVVGECGNVNSSEQLSVEGGQVMFEKLKNLMADEPEIVEEEEKELSAEEEQVEETPAVEEASVEEEAPEEEAQEVELEVATVNGDEILETIRALQEENRSLRETVENMQKSLSAYEENAKEFENKFKSLSVGLIPPEKPETVKDVAPIRTDGIGEF